MFCTLAKKKKNHGGQCKSLLLELKSCRAGMCSGSRTSCPPAARCQHAGAPPHRRPQTVADVRRRDGQAQVSTAGLGTSPGELSVYLDSRLSFALCFALLHHEAPSWRASAACDMQVTGHGIEAYLMDGVMEKRKCSSSSLVEESFEFTGYGSDPVIAQDQILDWNDRLQLQVEPQGERNLAQWPQHPESFRDLLHQYASKTKTVRDNILRAIAKILELEEDHFITHQMGDKAQAFARFNYYPPCPRPELVLGVKPHSDASVLTVLLVDSDVRGLQVKRNCMWFNVPAIPHVLVVNLGDFMEIMNNGIFKSPVHRVVTTAHKERISLALFYTVERDAVIKPTPRLLDDKRPARYRRVTEKDFLHEKTKEHVSKGLGAIETLKI
ncbi:hypothetical protein BS78_10G061400 [Paspalum vaginatum]|nr:hypothetical protein BS78_10G061400 [Paspalum vaginatum]